MLFSPFGSLTLEVLAESFVSPSPRAQPACVNGQHGGVAVPCMQMILAWPPVGFFVCRLPCLGSALRGELPGQCECPENENGARGHLYTLPLGL